MKNISNVIANHAEGGEVTSKLKKVMIISFMVGFIIGLWGYFQLDLRAQPTDPRKEELLRQSPNGNEWPSQILYDTVNACYQGTYKWIVMNNPSLIGTLPPPPTQRKMLEHCFCVLDKIRKEFDITKYIDNVYNSEWTGNLFMVKAIECVNDGNTLDGIIELQPTDNDTKTNIPPESKDVPQESLPDQPEEKASESSEPIFQG